jgi:flagellar basal body-associated protein FliL
MSKTRYIFLFLFVGLLALSGFQYFMLEVSDLDSISMVEEQQETIGQSVEVLGEEFKSPKFSLYTASTAETFKQKCSIIHVDKNYPRIYIAVPYSPPELS